MNELVFRNESGQPVTNSLLVAEKFGKRHGDVVRAIEDVMLKSPENERISNFAKTLITKEIPNGGKRDDPMYILTRDGFSIVVLGFTGAEAMEFKWEFIDAFNKMEAMLQSDDYIVMRSQEIMQGRVKQLEAKVFTQQLQLEAAEKVAIEQAPKVEYFDKCLDSNGFITVNVIAAELGISHIKLNKFLCEWGIQYRQSDCYVLYHQYRDRGYTVHRPHPYINSQGITITAQHMYWTEKGKKFIIEMYHKKLAA